MKFIIGEGGWSYLERFAYRGVIGLFYDNTFYGLLSYLIFGAVVFFTIVGLITSIKWLFTHKKKKRPY